VVYRCSKGFSIINKNDAAAEQLKLEQGHAFNDSSITPGSRLM
jgi:hypothetical protein